MGTTPQLIEKCVNKSYHETIETTPHEAQFGEKPSRSWTKLLDKDIVTIEPNNNTTDIYLRMKTKRQKAIDKVNERSEITIFRVGEKVLLRTNPISDAISKVVVKFCDLYEGPYIIKEKIGDATYILAFIDRREKMRGKFNERLLKEYNE